MAEIHSKDVKINPIIDPKTLEALQKIAKNIAEMGGYADDDFLYASLELDDLDDESKYSLETSSMLTSITLPTGKQTEIDLAKVEEHFHGDNDGTITIIDEDDGSEVTLTEEEIYKELEKEVVYTEGSTTHSPWAFEYPKWIEQEDSQKEAWRKFWDIPYEEIDVAQRAADFYILNGIINKAFSVDFDDLSLPSREDIETAGRKIGMTTEQIEERVVNLIEYEKSRPESALTKLTGQAEVLYTKLVSEMSEILKNYTHAACGGELRHHKAITSLSAVRKLAWCKWYFIYEKHGVEAISKMKELFLEFGGGAFGGEAWANAANVLYMYETGQLSPDPLTNKAIFIDRVFNLEHNTGCFLNKLSWVNLRKDRDKQYNQTYRVMADTVLKAHASNPIDLNMLYGHASDDIQKLCDGYMAKLADLGYPILCTWKENTGNVSPDKKGSMIYSGATKKINSNVTGVIDWSDDDEVEESEESTENNDPDIAKIDALLEKMNG